MSGSAASHFQNIDCCLRCDGGIERQMMGMLPNEVTYNSFIAARSKSGSVQKATDSFQVTHNSFLAACAKSGDMMI